MDLEFPPISLRYLIELQSKTGSAALLSCCIKSSERLTMNELTTLRLKCFQWTILHYDHSSSGSVQNWDVISVMDKRSNGNEIINEIEFVPINSSVQFVFSICLSWKEIRSLLSWRSCMCPTWHMTLDEIELQWSGQVVSCCDTDQYLLLWVGIGGSVRLQAWPMVKASPSVASDKLDK